MVNDPLVSNLTLNDGGAFALSFVGSAKSPGLSAAGRRASDLQRGPSPNQKSHPTLRASTSAS